MNEAAEFYAKELHKVEGELLALREHFEKQKPPIADGSFTFIATDDLDALEKENTALRNALDEMVAVFAHSLASPSAQLRQDNALSEARRLLAAARPTEEAAPNE